jgi:hypothetical protein
MRLHCPLALLTATTFACGGTEAPPTDVQTRDVRVAIPAPDPAYVDLVSPELVIQPGEDKMYCYYVTYDGDDIAVDFMDTEQGPFGHHVVILSTKEPQPDGTVEECGEAKDMWKFRSLILPETELPAGHGLRMRRGTQFVFQLHYVNAGAAPILVRDLARMRKIPVDQVTTWTATFTSNSLRLSIPPNTTGTETFDCTIATDSNLLILGGHMHEQGKHMEILVGPDTANLEMLYQVESWKSEYRDAPPVRLFRDAPLRLSAGSVIRTSCTWHNPTTETMIFPEEMCSGFGYVAGIEEPIHCEAVAQ